MEFSIYESFRNVYEITLGKSDNYIQANPGDPPADKDSLKAENPKITAKPRLGFIESFIRYHGKLKYRTPASVRKRNSTLQNKNNIQSFQRIQ